MGYPPEMDNKYFWYIVAALCGGYVFQVRKPEDIPWWRRLSHLAAGAACAVYFSPAIIAFYKLADTEWQYLVPFAVGAFWWKLFEAVEQSLGNIRFPWSK